MLRYFCFLERLSNERKGKNVYMIQLFAEVGPQVDPSLTWHINEIEKVLSVGKIRNVI